MIVAIKMVACNFQTERGIRAVLREIMILRKLTSMPDNVFTSHLYDVIIPTYAELDLDLLDHLFLVMDYVDFDLKTLFSKTTNGFDDNHVKIILYNLLCSLNFVHSANVIHRDLKPSNILITPQCNVKICDFGLSRSMPKQWDEEEKTTAATFRYSRAPSVSSTGYLNFNKTPTTFRTPNKKHIKMASIHIKQGTERKRSPPPLQYRNMSPRVQSRWYRAPEIIL